MVSVRVIVPPALQQGVEPTFCLYYGLFGHTYTNGRGIPFCSILVSWYGKWRLFLIHPVKRISIMKLSSWGHESHWNLLTRIFIICFWRCQWIFLECFLYHGVVLLILKASDQSRNFIEGFPSIIPMSILGLRIPLAGYTVAFIALMFFSDTNSAFMTKRILCFTWRSVSVGGLWGTWTPYDINNSLTLGFKLLKKVSATSNGNTMFCGSASI